MMRQIAITGVLAGALLTGPLPVFASDDSHDLGLVTWMGRLQYYTHKLGLSLDAGNQALVGYYTHEVEEVIEAIEDIESENDIPIGSLVKKILVPAFETFEASFETSLDSGDRKRLNADYDGLIAACNQCHDTAQRPYLVIQRNHDNPYLQRFEPIDAASHSSASTPATSE